MRKKRCLAERFEASRAFLYYIAYASSAEFNSDDDDAVLNDQEILFYGNLYMPSYIDLDVEMVNELNDEL